MRTLRMLRMKMRGDVVWVVWAAGSRAYLPASRFTASVDGTGFSGTLSLRRPKQTTYSTTQDAMPAREMTIPMTMNEMLERLLVGARLSVVDLESFRVPQFGSET